MRGLWVEAKADRGRASGGRKLNPPVGPAANGLTLGGGEGGRRRLRGCGNDHSR